MRALSVFIRNAPQLWRTSSHMPWNLRLVFWKSAYAFYAEYERKERERRALPAIGNPRLRAECCARRRDRFESRQLVKDIPELTGLLRPKGSAMFNNFFQCSVCGQEWVEVWTQEKMGGFHEVAKL